MNQKRNKKNRGGLMPTAENRVKHFSEKSSYEKNHLSDANNKVNAKVNTMWKRINKMKFDVVGQNQTV